MNSSKTCGETFAANLIHLRKLNGSTPPFSPSGLAAPRPRALCGAEIAWDTMRPISSATCKECNRIDKHGMAWGCIDRTPFPERFQKRNAVTDGNVYRGHSLSPVWDRGRWGEVPAKIVKWECACGFAAFDPCERPLGGSSVETDDLPTLVDDEVVLILAVVASTPVINTDITGNYLLASPSAIDRAFDARSSASQRFFLVNEAAAEAEAALRSGVA